MTRWMSGPEAVEQVYTWCATHAVGISTLLRHAKVHRSLLTRWSRGAAPQRRVWERIIAAQDDLVESAVSLEHLLGG